jgi:hypothetical protein
LYGKGVTGVGLVRNVMLSRQLAIYNNEDDKEEKCQVDEEARKEMRARYRAKRYKIA